MADVLIVIEKSLRRLTVYCNCERVKQFSVALGNSPVGPKNYEAMARLPKATITSVHEMHRASFICFLD
jgi:hypothetical protein